MAVDLEESMPHPRFSSEEIARRGEGLYEQRLRQRVESEENVGKMLSIDIETAVDFYKRLIEHGSTHC